MVDNTKSTSYYATEIMDKENSHFGEKPQHVNSFEKLSEQNWPTEPVPLRKDKKASMFLAIYDAVLLLVPVLLMIKIGLVIMAWKRDQYHNGDAIDLVSYLTLGLIGLNGQLVTLFTIIFAVIVSTLVRRYALWKAQRGAYVSELEQLQGSTSLPSTLKLIWSLRAFTVTSVSLVAIWSFYYLGSQASKLEYRLVNSVPYFDQYTATLAPTFPSAFYNDSDAFVSKGGVDDTNAGLISIIGYAGGSLYKAGTDLSGNPVVPDIKAILTAGTVIFPKSKPGLFGWVNVERQSELASNSAYSSLVGSPIQFLYESSPTSIQILVSPKILGKYKFTTNYFRFGCGLPQLQDYDAFPNNTSPGSLVSFNMTEAASDAPKDLYGNTLQSFAYSMRWTANEDQGISNNGSVRMLCNITSVAVDVQARCVEGGCFPQWIRYANGVPELNATKFETPFNDADFAARFFGNFSATRVANDLDGVYSTLQTEDYSSEDNLLDAPNFVNPRFNLYLNTYYVISQKTLKYVPSSDFFSGQESDPLLVRTKFDGALYNPHYAISWPWIALDFISCFILFIAAIIATYLRSMTLAPDIFGYVSSLTRDNPHLKGNLPDNGTGLDGIERARMLKGVKVKIGDVSGDDSNVARVGLALVKPTDHTGTASGIYNEGNFPRVRVDPLKPGMTVV